MDLLELQPDIKKTYEKCKYIVKLWEHKFVRKYKRLPSKLDIREANSEVRHAYRKYFQIKTAALEQSFIDVDGFDVDDNQENSENVQAGQEATTDSNEQDKNNLLANPCELDKSVLKENTPIPEPISEDVWGPHLNKKIDDSKLNLKNEETVKTNLNVNISKKLFCGSKFTKRNPRKLLSFSQKSKSDVTMENQISLSQPLPTTTAFGSFASEEAINLSADDMQCKNNSFQMITPTERVLSQPVNIIQSVLENNYQHTLKTVDTGWLQRIVQKVGTTIDNDELPESSSFSCNAMLNDSSSKLTKHVQSSKIDYDSEDIIDDSDDETTTKDIFHIAKKRKIDELPASLRVESNLNICKTLSEEKAKREDKTIEIKEFNNTIIDEIKDDGLKSQNQDVNIQLMDKTLKENIGLQETSNGTRRKRNSRVAKSNKQTKSKSRTSSTKTAIAENNDNVDDISPRRSSRQTKVKVNLQEFSSEEEDAFHTDTDEKDPEFNLNSSKSKRLEYIFQEEDSDETSKKKSENTKSFTATPKRKSNSNKKDKKKEAADEEEETDDFKPYELEFSVKPRIVAPRCSSIKRILTKNLVTEKGNIVEILEKNAKEDIPIVKDKVQQAKECLEKKIASGNLNDNYIRVNLKKKVFVRGKSGRSFSKYKKAQWKSKQAKALCGPDMDMGGCDGGMLTCFNCGQIGHFARNCKALKGDGLLPLASNQEEECPYPTLEEAAQMAKGSVLRVRIPKMIIQDNTTFKITENEESTELDLDEVEDNNLKVNETADGDDGMEIDFNDDIDSEQLLLEIIKLEEHVKKLDVQLYMDTVKVVKPYFELNLDGNTIATPPEVYEALTKFGHNSFRPGQEQSIMRILSGKSTLVTLSTGSGKSLCYQLPAYLYSQRKPCISLVISPLVSLMDDQVTGIPKFMKAACLHSNQTKVQRQKILDAISMGELSILLISPEAVVAGEKQIGFGSLLRKLPPIAFACIDEAHCVSQWSHNFRPSYLMICRVLRESLGVKTILGLTATATRATRDSIINHLQIPDGHDGVISDIPLPDNLILTASRDPLRDHALIGLLTSDRFVNCKSIIIYCTRRDECERIASFLRTSLKSEQVVEETNKKRKRVHLQAEPYHAGLAASRRRTIQNRFMSGELRIVVATVAFGMGINKSDIRAVIHYNMPNSFESYVQEVGRAGRDGLIAQCHVFMDSQGRDENELRRHIHANSIDRHVIRKLLQKVFIPCSCKSQCPKHEVAFSIEDTIRALDIPEENISTLLCYLELHENRYVELLSPAYTMCKVISYGGPMQIRKMAKECPPLAMALALHTSKTGNDPNVLEFPVVDVAATMGWESGICKHKLKNLEWITVNNQPKRSSISVQFSNLGFRLFAPGNLSDDELDATLDSLYNRVTDQEQKALLQLHAVHGTLMEITQSSYRACTSKEGDALIKSKVREYFNSPDPLKLVTDVEPKKFNEEQLVNDIRALICMYKDNTFTGRSVARILQGIQSPNYPATIWGRCKFWRSHLDIDFHTIVKVATREIIRMR